jgi:hypothetical protein
MMLLATVFEGFVYGVIVGIVVLLLLSRDRR